MVFGLLGFFKSGLGEGAWYGLWLWERKGQMNGGKPGKLWYSDCPVPPHKKNWIRDLFSFVHIFLGPQFFELLVIIGNRRSYKTYRFVRIWPSTQPRAVRTAPLFHILDCFLHFFFSPFFLFGGSSSRKARLLYCVNNIFVVKCLPYDSWNCLSLMSHD